MRRVDTEPRPDWRAQVEYLGLLFHKNEEGNYWNESAYYELTSQEVDVLETATNELHQLCLEAVQYVIDNKLYSELRIPQEVVPHLENSWSTRSQSLYGRFDLVYDGAQPPKLLEYNADTPTALLEAAVIQWHWLQEIDSSADQFNSIWEGLVEGWKSFKSSGSFRHNLIHFGCADSVEDYMTITALRDTANEAGLPTEALLMDEIGWDHKRQEFVDLKNRAIKTIFKLYPWEWIVQEEFVGHLFETLDKTMWIEPLWKMILSNKGLLPILWHLHPENPYLLEAYFDEPSLMTSYVKKPMLGREGSNVTVNIEGVETYTEGPNREDRFIYQRYARLPIFGSDKSMIIGSWIVGNEARGIGIRESSGPITTNLSEFVPHLFR